jgi:cytochrome c oxidase cbb3-type subunit III
MLLNTVTRDIIDMGTFWSIWVVIIVALNLIGIMWLLFANRKVEVRNDLPNDETPTTGHVYDGIEEHDNPLPKWWFTMFVLTAVFTVGYLIFYPGLGNFAGLLGWTSEGQWKEQLAAAEEKYGPVFAQYSNTPIEELSSNPKVLKMGGRLFANNCAVCHGADGRGAPGFPNLADDDWLYGGSPEAIKTTLVAGRRAMMPAFGDILGKEGVDNVVQYVFSLSGRTHDDAKATVGAKTFATYCSGCHGADGKGNQLMGAPNLTDNVWLYGGSLEVVTHTLLKGRAGRMPSQSELLKADKIHLLAAYVYSLSK